jgi:hypothetical protein
MPAVDTFMEGTLFIVGGPVGISESYALPEVTLDTAKANMLELVKWRRSILPGGFQVKWSQVHLSDKDRAAKAVISNPLASLVDAVPAQDAEDAGYFPVNETRDSVHLRFESADGRWANRWISAISDTEISDDLPASAWPAATAPFPAAPTTIAAAGPATVYWQRLRDFAEYVADHTRIVQKIKTGVDAGKFNLLEIESVILRGVGTRKRGRPFGQRPGREYQRLR